MQLNSTLGRLRHESYLILMIFLIEIRLINSIMHLMLRNSIIQCVWFEGNEMEFKLGLLYIFVWFVYIQRIWDVENVK